VAYGRDHRQDPAGQQIQTLATSAFEKKTLLRRRATGGRLIAEGLPEHVADIAEVVTSDDHCHQCRLRGDRGIRRQVV
jgi:hypothetical protein